MLLSIILVQSVGCDDVLESGVKEDRCKVCNGDGTSCKTVSGNVQNPCAGKYGQKLNTDNAHNTAISQLPRTLIYVVNFTVILKIVIFEFV